MIHVPTASRLIVVPMKDPRRSKTRLARALNDQDRASLALRLYHQTLERLATIKARHRAVFDVAVVTECTQIADIAQSKDACAVYDDGSSGLNGALERAGRFAEQHGYTSIGVLPADLAAPALQDIEKCVTFDLPPNGVLLCPSTDKGTNAFIAPLPRAFPFSYGPKSFLVHLEKAEDAGLSPIVAPWTSLKFDVDTAEDLALLPEAAFAGQGDA